MENDADCKDQSHEVDPILSTLVFEVPTKLEEEKLFINHENCYAGTVAFDLNRKLADEDIIIGGGEKICDDRLTISSRSNCSSILKVDGQEFIMDPSTVSNTVEDLDTNDESSVDGYLGFSKTVFEEKSPDTFHVVMISKKAPNSSSAAVVPQPELQVIPLRRISEDMELDDSVVDENVCCSVYMAVLVQIVCVVNLATTVGLAIWETMLWRDDRILGFLLLGLSTVTFGLVGIVSARTKSKNIALTFLLFGILDILASIGLYSYRISEAVRNHTLVLPIVPFLCNMLIKLIACLVAAWSAEKLFSDTIEEEATAIQRRVITVHSKLGVLTKDFFTRSNPPSSDIQPFQEFYAPPVHAAWGATEAPIPFQNLPQEKKILAIANMV